MSPDNQVNFLSPHTDADFEVWKEMVLDYEGAFGYMLDDAWNRLTTDPNYTLYFLEVENNVVGFIHLVTQQDIFRITPDRWLSDIYIKPSERNKGYASQALKSIIQKSKEEGYGVLHWIARSDSEARRIYDKFTTSEFAYYFHSL